MPGLKQQYASDVVPALQEKLGLRNRMQVPRLVKVVVNMGIGIAEKEAVDAHAAELAFITGQKPVLTRSRRSISNFKLRKGMLIGAKVTLRGDRMFEFLERLIHAALPRIRDFRGLPASSFDGRGNYTFGVREQTIFPEIDPDKSGPVQGMDITIVTTAKDRTAALELLTRLGLPFAAA